MSCRVFLHRLVLHKYDYNDTKKPDSNFFFNFIDQNEYFIESKMKIAYFVTKVYVQ